MTELDFVHLLENMFKEAGYKINAQEVQGKGPSDKFAGGLDLLVEKGSQQYVIEVKCFMEKTVYSERYLEYSISKVMDYYNPIGITPVFITYNIIAEALRSKLEGKYSSLIILDIQNLLAVIPDNSSLKTDLIAGLPFSISDIEPQQPKNDLGLSDFFNHSDNIKSLVKELELCESGKPLAREYEIICSELLKELFSEQLALWRAQPASNNDLYRFDLLCRIKNDNQNIFWSIIENNLQSKYVVFEFKNYTEEITQMQVYTTARYLYKKALRCVGIIIAAAGYDDHAEWAAKGVYRESGKLILLLEKNDLIKMANMKMDRQDPSELLLERIDNLLLELEV